MHEILGDVITGSDFFEEEGEALLTFELRADNHGEQHGNATPEAGARVSVLEYRFRVVPSFLVRQKRNNDGTILETLDDNPILDTRVYAGVFENGEGKEYGANVITETCGLSAISTETGKFLWMPSLIVVSTTMQ